MNGPITEIEELTAKVNSMKSQITELIDEDDCSWGLGNRSHI